MLGIPAKAVHDDEWKHLTASVPRDQIVHEMDYQDSFGTSLARIHRAPTDAARMCQSVFDVAHTFVCATAAVLQSARPESIGGDVVEFGFNANMLG